MCVCLLEYVKAAAVVENQPSGSYTHEHMCVCVCSALCRSRGEWGDILWLQHLTWLHIMKPYAHPSRRQADPMKSHLPAANPELSPGSPPVVGGSLQSTQPWTDSDLHGGREEPSCCAGPVPATASTAQVRMSRLPDAPVFRCQVPSLSPGRHLQLFSLDGEGRGRRTRCLSLAHPDILALTSTNQQPHAQSTATGARAAGFHIQGKKYSVASYRTML